MFQVIIYLAKRQYLYRLNHMKMQGKKYCNLRNQVNSKENLKSFQNMSVIRKLHKILDINITQFEGLERLDYG